MDFWGAIGGFLGFSRSQQPTGRQSVANAQVAGGAMRHTYDNDLPLHELVQSTASACLTARASERSVLRFLITEFNKPDTRLAIALQSLLDNPNPVQDRVEFIEAMSHCYDADGNVAIQLIRDEKGIPVEQWLMPSAMFAPRFAAADDPIPIGYMWQDGRSVVNPNDLVILRRTSIQTIPYKGRGILQDAEQDLKLLESILCAQRNYFINGGAPNVALTFPLGVSITTDQADAYRALWASRTNPITGVSNLGFVPDGGSVVNFGPNEMSFSESRDKTAAALRETFQTPRILLGDTDNVNHNNGQTAIAIFERTVVYRFGQKVAAAYEKSFRTNFHPYIQVRVDPAIVAGFTTLQQDNGLNTQSTDQHAALASLNLETHS